MIHRGYNRAPRPQLIPNLFSNILKVIAEAERPLTHHEIVEAVSERMDRSDEELKRQITVSLQDALIYGYLRVKNFRYSIVPDRLDPNEPREFQPFNKLPVPIPVAETKKPKAQLEKADNEQGTSKREADQDDQPETSASLRKRSQNRQQGMATLATLARISIRPRNTQCPGTETEEETIAHKIDLRPKALQRKME